MGIFVAILNKSGGSAAFGRLAEKHVHSKVGVQLATFILGILIFIDDYFNCLTVGSVMRPVTDRKKVSRAKLAFLIDATAAPVCMIAPVSSWAAAVSGYVQETNGGISGIEMFLRSIPYNYYSLLTLVFILVLIFMKIDYGPMAREEAKVRMAKRLNTAGEDETGECSEKGRTWRYGCFYCASDGGYGRIDFCLDLFRSAADDPFS